MRCVAWVEIETRDCVYLEFYRKYEVPNGWCLRDLNPSYERIVLSEML